MQSAARQYSRGMTLMELMIVVVIVSILASIAIPSYIQQVRKSRRVEAKTALLDLAGREERYFSTSVNGANYSPLPSDLGYTGAWPIPVGNNYYQVIRVRGHGPPGRLRPAIPIRMRPPRLRSTSRPTRWPAPAGEAIRSARSSPSTRSARSLRQRRARPSRSAGETSS